MEVMLITVLEQRMEEEERVVEVLGLEGPCLFVLELL